VIGHPVVRGIVLALGCPFVIAALSGGSQLLTNDAGAAVIAPCPTSGSAARGVTVAVIDSGITSIAQLGGAVDWSRSRSFMAGEALGVNDVHGTEMASIIHAGAPSANLLILKALDDQNGGSQAATAEAIRYAVGHGARVINLSAAGAEPSAAIHGAIIDAEQHDVLVVAAAGNDGFDNDEFPVYPANYQEPDLISVAAVDSRGDLVANSNWGARTVTLGALGLNVSTTTPSGSTTAVSGTSPAAALVSAAAANLLSGHPTLTATALRQRLIDTSRRTPQLRSKTISGGQLNSRLLGNCVLGRSS
jgi:subtilisin family serine protease